MEYREFEAKTVDAAIIAAMKAFRSGPEELDVTVLEEGSKGLFGIGGKQAKIKVCLKSELEAEVPAEKVAAPVEAKVEVKPESKPEPKVEDPEARPELPSAEVQEVLEQGQEFLTQILAMMQIEAEVVIEEQNVLNICGDGSGVVIGKRGQTLDSLQFILNRMVNRDREIPVYVNVDSEGYRSRHIDHLKSIAQKMSDKAKRTGHSVTLERMNPHDRRIIHMELKDDSRVNTRSIGDGSFKKVVIVPRKASRS